MPNTRGLAAAALVMAGAIAAPPTSAATFTADAVQEAPGSPAETARLFATDEATRMEFTRQGREVAQIFLPRQGLTRILFPQDKTYIELKGPAVAKAPGGPGGESPCASTAPADGCKRVAVDTSHGAPLEKWELTPPADSQAKSQAAAQGPVILWWDPARKKALRVDYPDGSAIQSVYKGPADWQGRKVEAWQTDFPASQGGRKALSLYDPELGVSVREELPDGTRQELRNIRLVPADPAWFALPADYRRIEPPAAPSPPPASR